MQHILCKLVHLTLSEEIAHYIVYHRLSHLSVEWADLTRDHCHNTADSGDIRSSEQKNHLSHKPLELLFLQPSEPIASENEG